MTAWTAVAKLIRNISVDETTNIADPESPDGAGGQPRVHTNDLVGYLRHLQVYRDTGQGDGVGPLHRVQPAE